MRTPDTITFRPFALVRTVASFYMVFGMSEIATVIGVMFLAQELELEFEAVLQ